MIEIKQIEWLSELAKEAQLTLSDGEYTITAFCHPCHLQVGQSVEMPLYSLDISDCTIENDDLPCSITQSEDSLDAKIVATVFSMKDKLVQLGQFFISVDDEFPGDAVQGSKLQFTTARLDADDIGNMKRVLRTVPYDYTFYKENGQYYLDVLSGGAAAYQIHFQLNEEESSLYQDKGFEYLDQLVQKVHNNNRHFYERAQSQKYN